MQMPCAKIANLPDGGILSPLLCGPELYQVLAELRFANALPGEWRAHMALYEGSASGDLVVCYVPDGSLLAIRVNGQGCN